MTDNSVKAGSTSYLLGSTIATSAYAKYTIICSYKLNNSPANGNYRAVYCGRIADSGGFFPSDGNIIYQFPPDDTDSVYTEYKVGNHSTGDTTNDDVIGTNSALVGHWIHTMYQIDTGTGAQAFRAAKEGFNPVSPSYLYNTSISTLVNAHLIGLNVWVDTVTEGDFADNVSIGHIIVAPFIATEAQWLAQWAQRAPTSAFTSNGSYIYLPFTDHTSPGTQSGTDSITFAATGTFSADSTMPSEWGSTGSLIDVSVNDTPAVSDSIARDAFFGRTPSDTASVTDSITVEKLRLTDVSVSDTIAILDSGFVESLFLEDTVSVTDAIAVARELGRSSSDTVSLTDSITVEKLSGVIDVAASDTASITDSILRDVQWIRSPSDTASASDACGTSLEYARTGSDTASTSDAVALALEYGRAPSDTASTSDTAGTALEYSRALADTASITDTADAQVISPSLIDVSASDTLSITDAILRDVSYVRSLSDTASTSDSVLAERLAPGVLDVAVQDSISATDTLGSSSEYARALQDSLTASDAASTGLEASRAAADVLGVGDSLALTIEYGRALNDSLSSSDSVLTETAYVRAVSDALTVSDEVDIRVSGPTLDIEVSDFFDVGDFISAQSISSIFVRHTGRTITVDKTDRTLIVPATTRTIKVDSYDS